VGQSWLGRRPDLGWGHPTPEPEVIHIRAMVIDVSSRARIFRRPSAPPPFYDVRRARTAGSLEVRHHVTQVSDERPSDVLGALPRRRPQRRSDKRQSREPYRSKVTNRANAPAATGTATVQRPEATATLPTPPLATPRRRTQPLRQPAQPPGTPPTSQDRPGDQPTGRHILGTAAQAAAELAGIGLSISARALRNAVDRLPRP
jgi:hypothetical protein